MSILLGAYKVNQTRLTFRSVQTISCLKAFSSRPRGLGQINTCQIKRLATAEKELESGGIEVLSVEGNCAGLAPSNGVDDQNLVNQSGNLNTRAASEPGPTPVLQEAATNIPSLSAALPRARAVQVVVASTDAVSRNDAIKVIHGRDYVESREGGERKPGKQTTELVTNSSLSDKPTGLEQRPIPRLEMVKPAPIKVVPRLEGFKRLGIKPPTWSDWNNKDSPRFKDDLPKMRKMGGSSVFIEKEIDDYIMSRPIATRYKVRKEVKQAIKKTDPQSTN